MNSVIGRKKYSLVLVLIILFALTVSALNVSVVLTPESGGDFVEIYPFELANYNLVITNNSEETIKDLTLEVTVDSQLIIVDGENETSSTRFIENELFPTKTVEKKITVKALTSSAKNQTITVNYGTDRFTNSASTFLKVNDNPINVKVRAEKIALNPSEEGKLLLDIKNSSGETLKNLKVQLSVPEGFTSLGEVFKLDSLDPNQEIKNKEFKLKVGAEVVGKHSTTLRLSYEDKLGIHFLENKVEFDILDRNRYFYLVIVVLVGLIALSYYLKKQPPKIDTSKLHEQKGS